MAKTCTMSLKCMKAHDLLTSGLHAYAETTIVGQHRQLSTHARGCTKRVVALHMRWPASYSCITVMTTGEPSVWGDQAVIGNQKMTCPQTVARSLFRGCKGPVNSLSEGCQEMCQGAARDRHDCQWVVGKSVKGLQTGALSRVCMGSVKGFAWRA